MLWSCRTEEGLSHCNRVLSAEQKSFGCILASSFAEIKPLLWLADFFYKGALRKRNMERKDTAILKFLLHHLQNCLIRNIFLWRWKIPFYSLSEDHSLLSLFLLSQATYFPLHLCSYIGIISHLGFIIAQLLELLGHLPAISSWAPAELLCSNHFWYNVTRAQGFLFPFGLILFLWGSG